MLADDVIDDVQGALHMDTAPSTAGGANHHGDAQAAALCDDELQVLEHRRIADDGDAFTQLVGTRVRATCIHNDGIGMLGNPSQKGLLGESVPQDSAGRKYFHLFHVPSPFYPCLMLSIAYHIFPKCQQNFV